MNRHQFHDASLAELARIARKYGVLMGYPQCLKTQHAAGTLFTGYTTSKSVINPQALLVIPAGFLQVGDQLRITVAGAISNIVTTPGTITFEVKFGPTANIIAFTTGALQLNATAHTTLPFWLDILLSLRSDGPGATAAQFMGQAIVSGLMMTRTAGQTDDAQGIQALTAPATAPALGTAYDSTVANLLDLWAGFSISNAGNGVQIQQYMVELLSERN